MRKLKAIDYGKDLTPRQIWAEWARETHELVRAAVTQARVRADAPQMEPDTAPNQQG